VIIAFSSQFAVHDAAAFAEAVPYMATYFGKVTKPFKGSSGELSVEQWNQLCQVFPESAWDTLLAELKKAQASGGATYAKLTLPVLPNAYQGIVGGYEAETVWILNGGASKWTAALPAETAAAVKEMGTKHKFPYVSPSCLSWDPAMVACLANLSTWALLEAAHTISPWLSGGPAAV